MGFFHCVKEEYIFMKTTIEQLKFPCEIKNKLKMKASFGNLDIKFIDGHLIKFDKTNLSVKEPHKIIINNNVNTLVAYLYDDNDKIYIPNSNTIISLNRFISILNEMNKIGR